MLHHHKHSHRAETCTTACHPSNRVINMQVCVWEVLCCALTPWFCWLEPWCELKDTLTHTHTHTHTHTLNKAISMRDSEVVCEVDGLEYHPGTLFVRFTEWTTACQKCVYVWRNGKSAVVSQIFACVWIPARMHALGCLCVCIFLAWWIFYRPKIP